MLPILFKSVYVKENIMFANGGKGLKSFFFFITNTSYLNTSIKINL